MHRSLLRAALCAAGAICLCSAATAGTLVPIPPYPGSTTTVIRGINDNDVITGTYTTQDGVTHGFVGTLDGNYTSFDHPNGQTIPEAISNDGYITGLGGFSDACGIQGCSFLRTPGGTINAITKNGVTLDGVAQGIIGHTKFVGQYNVLDENNHTLFYGYYGKGTKYRKGLTLPFNTTRTSPRGYNKAGTVTGFFLDLDNGSTRPGFVLKNGVATRVNYPDQNAFFTLLEDVNDKGMIVGAWGNQDGTIEQAVLYDFGKNAFSPISVPGAATSYANAINNAGVVAVSGDFTTSYIYCTRKACPLSQGAIAVPERWVSGVDVHSAICRNGCVGPLHKSSNKADAATIREAAGRDPVVRLELGPSRAR
jgi:uncharacterized membrane protein